MAKTGNPPGKIVVGGKEFDVFVVVKLGPPDGVKADHKIYPLKCEDCGDLLGTVAFPVTRVLTDEENPIDGHRCVNCSGG